MGSWRNVSNEDRLVGYGLPVVTTIAADAVLVVPDEADASYEVQPDIWQPVVAPVTPTVPTAPADAPVAN
jgi:hypothetical protein